MRPDPLPSKLPPVSAKLIVGIGGVVAALAVVVMAVAGGGTASATIAFRNDTGQPCSFCHATPGTDMKILTIEGQRFQNNGYKIVGPAPPAAPPSYSPPPAAPQPGAQGYASLSCGQLWHERNAIFAQYGYCFKTPQAINAFGRACFPPYGQLPAREQARVDNIIGWERRKGCSG